jgi:hypothetical protein
MLLVRDGAEILLDDIIAHSPLSAGADPRQVISRSPAISANLCAGFLAATHQFQLCS